MANAKHKGRLIAKKQTEQLLHFVTSVELHCHTTVNINRLSGNIVGITRCQKANNSRDLFRLGNSLLWNDAQDSFFLLFIQLFCHISFNKSGCNCIHLNIAGSELFCNGFGESDNSCFGRNIVRLSRIANNSHYRRNIDDFS